MKGFTARFATVAGEETSANIKCEASHTIVVPFGDRLGRPSGPTVATNPRRCCAYVHDAELDGDESLTIGTRIEIRDDAGRMFAATVTGRDGQRWQLTIRA